MHLFNAQPQAPARSVGSLDEAGACGWALNDYGCGRVVLSTSPGSRRLSALARLCFFKAPCEYLERLLKAELTAKFK